MRSSKKVKQNAAIHKVIRNWKLAVSSCKQEKFALTEMHFLDESDMRKCWLTEFRAEMHSSLECVEDKERRIKDAVFLSVFGWCSQVAQYRWNWYRLALSLLSPSFSPYLSSFLYHLSFFFFSYLFFNYLSVFYSITSFDQSTFSNSTLIVRSRLKTVNFYMNSKQVLNR